MALDSVLSDKVDSKEEDEMQQKWTSTAVIRYLVQLVRHTTSYAYTFFSMIFHFFAFFFLTFFRSLSCVNSYNSQNAFFQIFFSLFFHFLLLSLPSFIIRTFKILKPFSFINFLSSYKSRFFLFSLLVLLLLLL